MAAESGAGGAPGGSGEEVTGERVKVVVVGDGAVGKTSLLVSFTLDRFPTEHVPTVFANFAKKMMVCGDEVNLWLCDTAGQEEFDRLRVMSYTDTQIFLLCFSVTDPASLHNVAEKWLPEVQFHCPSAQCLLVATKEDLRENEQEIQRLTKDGQKPVSTEQGQKLAQELGLDTYLECSALTQTGVEEVFEMAARVALSPRNVPIKRRKTQSQKLQAALTKPCIVS
ncbi:cdc42 homolog [Babylonia areolata]|uniref:cdc42 homolog n=1 Tax=Babylonia areolata TaxID=304850 RepID=UPI003FD1E66E